MEEGVRARIAQEKKSGSSIVVSELKEKKNGRPLMLGEDLDRKVRTYIQDTRRLGNAITTRVVMAGALGIVKKKDKNLLAENGGHIVINKSWARYLLQHMNYVNRKACSKAKVTVPNFDEVKANFLCDVKATVEMEEIPLPLIINWDHTSLKYVPSSSWTMAEEDSKCDLAGIDEKASDHGCTDSYIRWCLYNWFTREKQVPACHAPKFHLVGT